MSEERRELVVAVTGASAGVGRAVIREFARKRARIGLMASDRQRLEAARRDVEALGGHALVLPLDVADPAAVEHAAARIEAELGPLDIWVNNAMVSVFSPVREMEPTEYRRVTEVTYLGYVHGTLAALKRMLPRDRGVIVQVGSALAYRAIPLQSAYCAAKHAVSGFTESLRTELLHEGSRVQVVQVHLPAVNTPQFSWSKSRMPRKPQPVPPIYAPEVVARAIVHAALNPRREMLVGWPTIKAVWAERLVPAVADIYLARYGYESQQTDEPADPYRPNNLWKPVVGDFAAEGVFRSRARSSSALVWLATHRPAVALGAALLLMSLAAAAAKRRSQDSNEPEVAGRHRKRA